jgi:hypothetical protein
MASNPVRKRLMGQSMKTFMLPAGLESCEIDIGCEIALSDLLPPLAVDLMLAIPTKISAFGE